MVGDGQEQGLELLVRGSTSQGLNSLHCPSFTPLAISVYRGAAIGASVLCVPGCGDRSDGGGKMDKVEG